MKVPFYSIRDKLAGFGYPTVDLNDQTAKRNFAVAVNNPSVNSMSFAPVIMIFIRSVTLILRLARLSPWTVVSLNLSAPVLLFLMLMIIK